MQNIHAYAYHSNLKRLLYYFTEVPYSVLGSSTLSVNISKTPHATDVPTTDAPSGLSMHPIVGTLNNYNSPSKHC